MYTELNLPLTAKEAMLVKIAILRLLKEEKRYVDAIILDRKQEVEYIKDIDDMNRILEKIERMTDEIC